MSDTGSDRSEPIEAILVDEKDLKDKTSFKNSDKCKTCSAEFKLFTRRHHCRLCSFSFCDTCSKYSARTSLLKSESYRCCQACFASQNDRTAAILDEAENDDPVVELNLPKMDKAKQSNAIRIARTFKLGRMLLPILNSYRASQTKVAALRKKYKDDDATFEKHRRLLMDEQHAKEAPNFKTVLVKMGGLYNKGAQLAASQQLIMPARLVEELKTCFEDMPPRKWSKIEQAIALGLGEGDVKQGRARMATAFDSFDQEPLAAASIGQVHFATMAGGERCVVKVLYPEIRKNMAADLATMKTSIQMVVSMLGLQDMKGMIDIFYNEVAENFPRELDFNIELAHMEYAHHLLSKHSPHVMVPKAFKDLSCTGVLTQELVKGVTLNKIGNDKDPQQMARGRHALDQVIDAMGLMVFKDGFFHADPHPGNIMVLEDGRPSIIDWGQCMNLTKPQRRRLCQMVMLLRTRCMDLIVTGLNNSGFEFPADSTNATAAIIFFFFDSAIKSDFSADIEEFGATVRSTPSNLPMPTDMPREVIFFARVMQCLRRDCEVLEVDISAIDRWAPIARSALQAMVYDDPIPRNLSAAPVDPNAEKDEDDTAVWSPSRLLLLVDTAQFGAIAKGVEWAQANPAFGDALVTWTTDAATANPQVASAVAMLATKHKGTVSSAVTFAFSKPFLVVIVLVLWTLMGLLGLKNLLLGA